MASGSVRVQFDTVRRMRYKKGNISRREAIILEFLITSATRRELLACFVGNERGIFHLRELSRKIGKPAPVVKRELEKLEQVGFVLSWYEGNQRCFQVNRRFIFLPELESLVAKAASLSAGLRVLHIFDFDKMAEKRALWQKRSMEIAREPGRELKRRRPRHPTEARLLKRLS